MKKKSFFDGLKKQARTDRERGMISSEEAVEFYRITGKFVDKGLISKAIDSWVALKERWRKLGTENRDRKGKTMTEKTLEKMRSSQRARRKRELRQRWRHVSIRASSSSSED
jgi:hypothetical protein